MRDEVDVTNPVVSYFYDTGRGWSGRNCQETSQLRGRFDLDPGKFSPQKQSFASENRFLVKACDLSATRSAKYVSGAEV
jgi:hypothetical protein